MYTEFMCSDHEKLEVINTPKYLYACTLSSEVLSRCREGDTQECHFFVITIHLHLDTLNFRKFSAVQ